MLDRDVTSAVDPDEAAQREVERKAKALLELQWSNGAGAAVWAHAAQDALAVNESVNERLATADEDREAWQRFHASALMVVGAIDQVRVYERCVRRLISDAELAQARERFNEVCGDYLNGEEMVGRDLLSLDAHLDKYAVGEGSSETRREQPLFSDAIVVRTDDGTRVEFGGHDLFLRVAVKAAAELAEVVERVIGRHVERISPETHAALRRRRRELRGRPHTR